MKDKAPSAKYKAPNAKNKLKGQRPKAQGQRPKHKVLYPPDIRFFTLLRTIFVCAPTAEISYAYLPAWPEQRFLVVQWLTLRMNRSRSRAACPSPLGSFAV